MVDELKFAWAYLLQYGKLTNGKWNYYGGTYLDQDGRYSWDVPDEMKEFRQKVLEVGIDWDKTGVPTVSQEGQFQDTGSPSKDCLGTLGTLYLKNGESFLVGSGDNDAAHLAETARKMIQGKTSDVFLLAKKL